MNMKKIALVGCGRILKKHVEAINANEGIELSLVCDIDEAIAKKTAESLEIDYVKNMSDIQNVDVITIATPSGLHPEHVVNIAENCDVPLILCEKPISLTVREAVRMFKIIKKEGKILLPVYQNCYNPLIDFTRNLIVNNSLGKIYQFNVNVFWNRDDDYYKVGWHGTLDVDGGVLYTQASHYVDMILFLFGKLKDAKGLGGRLRQLEVQDSVSAVFEFENGTVGSLNTTVSTYRQNYLTELTIIGEKGTMRLSGTNLNSIDFWDVKDLEKPDIDFKLNNIYGKGYDIMYKYIVDERYDLFPAKEEVITGISLMEKLSF